jgi:hypothetical protein
MSGVLRGTAATVRWGVERFPLPSSIAVGEETGIVGHPFFPAFFLDGDRTAAAQSGFLRAWQNLGKRRVSAMRGELRRLLAWGVIAAVLLPVVLAIVLGLGTLLSSLGDESGGAVCRRAALVVGVAWLVSVVASALTSSIIVLDGQPVHGGPPPDRLPVDRDPRDRPS